MAMNMNGVSSFLFVSIRNISAPIRRSAIFPPPFHAAPAVFTLLHACLFHPALRTICFSPLSPLLQAPVPSRSFPHRLLLRPLPFRLLFPPSIFTAPHRTPHPNIRT